MSSASVRLALLRSLGGALAPATTKEAVLEAAKASLSLAGFDFPFSLIYLFDPDGIGRLAFSTGLEAGHPAAPTNLRPGTPDVWPLDRPDVALDVAAVAGLPTGAWTRPPTQAVCVALEGQGGDAPIGMMVFALNPHRSFDPETLSVMRLLAGQIASSLASANAFQAERRRVEVLAELVRLRKAAAAALEIANARLSSEVEQRTAERDRIWQTSTDMLCVAGIDGYFLSLNPAWATTLGWTEEEMKAQPFLHFVHPQDVAKTIEAAAGLSAGAAQLSFENRYRDKQGDYHWFSWNAVPREGLIYASVRDVTEVKEAAWREQALEEQLRQSQKMEAVGQLTGGLAHDFNNLLTGITGSLDILASRLSRQRFDDLGRFIDAAQDAARRAAALTHRLLAFSRRQTLDPRTIDANRLIADMGDLVRRTVGPPVTVDIVAAPDLWTILVDPNQLENALLNLCINARDAMPDGGRILIETRNVSFDTASARERDLPPGPYVALSVTDSGTGISSDVLERVFDPFFTTKPLGQGTGLGLSMIHGFVHQSGGEIGITSEVGHGTTIVLHLPRHLGVVKAETIDLAVQGPVAAGTETVLVVDDEATVRMLVVEALEELGHRVIEATNGSEGLRALETNQAIDLLVTDVGMPGLNGRQLADAARLLRPDLRILFITGYAEHAVFDNGQLEPGMRILTKPFAMDALGGLVTDMIAKR